MLTCYITYFMRIFDIYFDAKIYKCLMFLIPFFNYFYIHIFLYCFEFYLTIEEL